MQINMAVKVEPQIANIINPIHWLLIAKPLEGTWPPLGNHWHLGLLNTYLHPGGNAKGCCGIN
jgi:hypothetical protein